MPKHPNLKNKGSKIRHPLARKRPFFLLTWKTKFNDLGEKKHLYSNYEMLHEAIWWYNIHTIKYYLTHKKVNFEDNKIKIEKVYLNDARK